MSEKCSGRIDPVSRRIRKLAEPIHNPSCDLSHVKVNLSNFTPRVQEPTPVLDRVHSSTAPVQSEQEKNMQSKNRRFLPGFLMMAIGILGWWYNWHLANTAGYFYIKLCLLAPLGI